MNNDNRKIGIMGGTFDPPHLGHLISAQKAAEQLKLDRVIFIPTGNIYYKDSKKTLAADIRYEMVKLAICDNPIFDISDIETKSDGYSYTSKTLSKLKEIYPNAKFYFIVGADSLDYMDRWKNPKEIFSLCTVAAVGREGFSDTKIREKTAELREKFGAEIVFLDMPKVNVSSTQIRELVNDGKQIDGLVTKNVEEYIKTKNLYKSGDADDGNR